MVEVIEMNDAPYMPVRNKHHKEHSNATETVLRQKFDKLVKENPGEKSAIAGEFRKY